MIKLVRMMCPKRSNQTMPDYQLNFDRNHDMAQLTGELSMQTVPQILDEAEAVLAQADDILRVDLDNVTHSDSAGLALLINWMRRTQQLGKQIEFYHIPSQMLAIASASGLEKILPLKS